MKSTSNKELTEELHKLVIRKFKKKSTLNFCRQYLGQDPADMQLISKFSKGFRFSLCAIDIYRKIYMGYSFKR